MKMPEYQGKSLYWMKSQKTRKPRLIFYRNQFKIFMFLNDGLYITETVEEAPFNYLMCDLPAPPLFPDGMQENIIPQVPIFQILNKFNGIQEKEYKTYKDSTMKKFELTRLPPYIILYFKVWLQVILFFHIFSVYFYSIWFTLFATEYFSTCMWLTLTIQWLAFL